jgi:hypothetical protein
VLEALAGYGCCWYRPEGTPWDSCCGGRWLCATPCWPSAVWKRCSPSLFTASAGPSAARTRGREASTAHSPDGLGDDWPEDVSTDWCARFVDFLENSDGMAGWTAARRSSSDAADGGAETVVASAKNNGRDQQADDKDGRAFNRKRRRDPSEMAALRTPDTLASSNMPPTAWARPPSDQPSPHVQGS